MALLSFFAVLAAPPATAQSPGEGSLSAGSGSVPEAIEAIQRARVTTRILFITAHPDDEYSTLLAYLGHGLGADAALLTLTRGEGGQNAIGPELGPQLAMIRSAELLGATQTEGVRLFFTRAPDFGYSKTVEETMKVWGDQVLSDMVRVIRTFRPQVVINGWAGARAGHGNHQASGLLTPKAVAAAGDPNAFPEQLVEGLRAWKVEVLLNPSRSGTGEGWQVPTDEVSPIWGKTYNDIGIEGYVQHRSQGVPAFLNNPFVRRKPVLARADGNKFDPGILAEPLTSLAALGLASAPLNKMDDALARARDAAMRLDWAQAMQSLGQAGQLAAELETSPANADARWELAHVRERIDAALASAAALHIDALADRSEIVAGEDFTVRVRPQRRATIPGEFAKPALVLPAGWSVTKEETEANGVTRFTVAIPKGAQPPRGPADWMLPFPPPLVQARVHGVVEGYAFDADVPVIAQRVTSTRVDTLPLTLVPAVTLALEPRQFLLVEKRPPKQIELVARVHSYSSAATKVTVGIEGPAGWQATPPSTVEFSGTGDQLARFRMTLPAKIAPGKYELKAYAKQGGERFRTTVEPLPSLSTRLWSEPAVADVHVFNIVVPEGLRVGYIAAENDPIPESLRRLGIRVELLDPAELVFTDLRRFDAVVVGIWAYELRPDVARANARLLDYAANGGTLVVQLQRENAWNSVKPAPFPATIGTSGPAGANRNEAQPTTRITDENSPVRFVAPDHPVLNFPNKITQEDFQGWVQDRGLYFWTQWDSRYQPVLAMRDPGENETTGALLYARYGKGVYIFTGLAFFRQLPEGVPGAYRLFVNLLSQGKLRSDAAATKTSRN